MAEQPTTGMRAEYAEDVGHYWLTSKVDPDAWLDKARDEVTRMGGTVLGAAMGTSPQTGRTAYMLMFEIGGERFRLVWPALPSVVGNMRAARIQAATMLYRDVVARCITARVLGPRVAFLSFLVLPDGRTAGEVATPDLLEAVPRVLMISGGR